jgi:hypothetical protein
MNANRYNGHTPKLSDTVWKRMTCVACGVSWDRGRPPLGPCHGKPNADTPAMGTKPALRDGIYRGPTKAGT